MAGLRDRTDGGAVSFQGSYGYYWSSSPISTNARALLFYSSSVYPQGSGSRRAYGFSVRCFKD
ncbi:hypothetical protein AGMMS50256_31780 [Betaproteobacteria bacterium]|nr:hypothetical protein AGMMS50256_31780 [Betaproteobacteria bacterium]